MVVLATFESRQIAPGLHNCKMIQLNDLRRKEPAELYKTMSKPSLR